MSYPNVFNKEVSDQLIERISQLNAASKPQWGKMNASQLMAHCNVTYEYLFEPGKYQKPTGLKKWLIKTFVKATVVGDKPYKKNSPTAPDFKAAGESNADFEKEKERLISFINKVQEMGEDQFEGKESHSFGPLTKKEWNTMFYKHLDYHLNQFGV